MEENKLHSLYEALTTKATLKQKVYTNTFNTLQLFIAALQNTVTGYHEHNEKSDTEIPFEFRKKGDFELEVKFGGDILLFLMHTNVFEFSRHHEVMKTSYVREDPERSYCGVINIYNFLADSFKYNRVNDIGYLIGRVFINKDMHYFVEGKREIGQIYNNFRTNLINETDVQNIVESSIRYTLNFDLLAPPYENVKEVSVYEMMSTLDNITLKTGKRMGFQFRADREESNENAD